MKKQTVYKKDALEFVNVMQIKAINSVIVRHSELIKSREEQLFTESGFQAEMEYLQDQLNRLADAQIKLGQKMKGDKTFSYNSDYYGGFENIMDRFCGVKLIEHMKHHCTFQDAKLTTLKKQKDKEIAEVKAEYRNLYGLCNKQDNGEKAGKILADLGFDISSITRGEQEKALSLNIDKTKLFVCGDNK